MPPLPDSSVITVACRPDDFSASALAHAVEDSDAHLVNLNVTGLRLEDGRITVELRTNRLNSESTVRSLMRYGFDVLGPDAAPAEAQADDSPLRARALHLLHLLEI